MLQQLGHVKHHSLRGAQQAFPSDAPARRRAPVVAARASVTPTEPAPQAPQQQPPAVLLDDSRTQTFMNWARGPASIRFAGVKPSTFAGIRGLAASSDIANDALIVEVPRHSAVVLAPKQRNSCPGMVNDEWWKNAPWFAKMGAMLLWHKRQGSQSPLAPWIAQLPADTGVPLNWSDKQLAALQYPYLVAQVGRRRDGRMGRGGERDIDRGGGREKGEEPWLRWRGMAGRMRNGPGRDGGRGAVVTGYMWCCEGWEVESLPRRVWWLRLGSDGSPTWAGADTWAQQPARRQPLPDPFHLP